MGTLWEKGTGIAGGGRPGDKLHLFVTLVHGIFTQWTGERTIEHFTSDDGVNWALVSSLPLASRRVIDPTVYRIDGIWHLWYKNEAASSHTFLAESNDLITWQNKGEVIGGRGHEAPFVWRWKGAYWMINDAAGLEVYRSETGVGQSWVHNTTLLNNHGQRPMDTEVGHHPWIVVQGEPGNEQLVLFYFSHGAGRMNGGGGRRTYVHMAEITLGEDGKVVCDRDKYPAGR